MKRKRHRGEEIIKKLHAIGEELAARKRVEERGVPEFIRSDNGSEFIANACQGVDLRERNKDSLHRSWRSVAEPFQLELQRALP